MEALDTLEKRIESLNRILGSITENDRRNENLTDSLLSANTLISSALSGRDKIKDVVQRSSELEQYLDPDFINSKDDIKAKEVYVNTVAPELAENFELLEEIKSLEPSLGAEYFANIPDVVEQFKQLNESAKEKSSQNDILEESLILAMQRYNEIHEQIKNSLNDLNDRLDRVEKKLTTQKKVEE